MAENEHYTVGDIIREEVAKITEERLRTIVREELKSLLESLAKNASDSDGHETGELESAGLRAINGVMESEAAKLPHAWDCSNRKRSWSWEKSCTCGVGEQTYYRPGPLD